jgi:hypothetical protein
MAYHYLRVLRDVGPRKFGDIVVMVPPPQSWMYLGPDSWLYAWQQKLGIFDHISYAHEQRLGIGWLTLPLAVWGLYSFAKERGAWVKVMFLSTIVIVMSIMLYPGGFTPWKYLYHLFPGANALRAASRIGFLILIPLSIGLAYVVNTRKLIFAAVAIALVCFAEQGQWTPSYDKFQLRTDVAKLERRVPRGCTAFYYSPHYETTLGTPPQYKLQIDAMWAAFDTGIPTVNGYSGNFATGWWDLFDNKLVTETDVARIRTALERWASDHRLDPASVCWIRTGDS